jgi:hypothetical protein
MIDLFTPEARPDDQSDGRNLFVELKFNMKLFPQRGNLFTSKTSIR